VGSRKGLNRELFAADRRKQKTESRRQKAEGRKQKAESRKQKAESRKQMARYLEILTCFNAEELRAVRKTCAAAAHCPLLTAH
jgi:hypothetical protein